MGPFGFERLHILLHLCRAGPVIVKPVVVMGPRTREVLQQVQAVVQAALPLGPYDPAGPITLAVKVADTLSEAIGSSCRGTANQTLTIFLPSLW